VKGTNTPENVMNYLAEVRAKCLELNFPSVLIEENLQGPGLNIVDIFEVVNKASKQTYSLPLHIAFVDLNPEHEKRRMDFAESVAVNRGVDVKIFSSVTEAEKWLTAIR
jgi:hypothetical protein